MCACTKPPLSQSSPLRAPWSIDRSVTPSYRALPSAPHSTSAQSDRLHDSDRCRSFLNTDGTAPRGKFKPRRVSGQAEPRGNCPHVIRQSCGKRRPMNLLGYDFPRPASIPLARRDFFFWPRVIFWAWHLRPRTHKQALGK